MAPWAAPMFAVPKKNGDIRLVVDYRHLNSVTVPDPYVMPRIEVLLETMGAASIFTKLDLKNKKRLLPGGSKSEHQDKTTFVTPFGLRNAQSTFQRLMDSVLSDILVFSRCYIDDISIFSKSWSEHVQHLRAIFERLHGATLTLQMSKCNIGTHSCEFLGHTVGVGSISPQQAKVDAMASFHRPITSKLDLDKVVWIEECQYALDKLKLALTTNPTLAPPDYDRSFLLQTDTSDRGISVVLSQDYDGKERPVTYHSRKLLPRERRYSATDKESLAVVSACKHFLPYLIGRRFTVITDHQALKFLHNKDITSGRLARWFDLLMELDFDIRHRRGADNGNTDGLSRQAWPDDSTLQMRGEMSDQFCSTDRL